jgi:CubicO group peptidase (beta-lactamase class C family)
VTVQPLLLPSVGCGRIHRFQLPLGESATSRDGWLAPDEPEIVSPASAGEPLKAKGRRVRRWFLLAGGVFGLLIAAVLGVYAWAWLSTDDSTIARAIIWRESDVGDQHRFPARRIPAGARASPLRARVEGRLVVGGEGKGLDEFLRETDTLAFLVVHRDRLAYERYFDGATRESLQTSFSAAKSFVSTLVGIAIEAGLIGSVGDPVTDYLPELAARDPRFRQITLRHLLTMSSGIRYQEGAGFPWPFGDDTYTYYGVDLRDVALNRTRIEGPPGLAWQYNNFNPLLLGLVLERATGTSVSDFMARRLWQPLGAEADATWNLDSDGSGFEKMESGLNARPVDYARFGLLFLHNGEWNGRRIVPEDWVRAATGADPSTDQAYYHGYRYFWWLDVERPGRFYALGKYGQYIYVAPDADAVVVRFGRDWGVDNVTWLATFRDVADQLERRT